jgi:ribosomal peptide maturation radical SAM protein 1
MENNWNDSFNSLILVSTPWPLFSHPSIQLGTLKAYLRSQFPDVNVEAHHLYLNVAESIGYKLYQTISEKTWLAETVYAALLFPERMNSIEKVFHREAKGKPLLKRFDFKDLTSRIKEISENFIHRTDWGAFGLAGFSVCLCQLTSALYFIKRIKEKFPNLIILVGGSTFAGESALKLVQEFPQVDFVINGEGELPLSQLVRHLRNPQQLDDILSIPGVVARKTTKSNTSASFYQMEDLSHLPPPDFHDYFNLLRTFSPEKTFFPTLTSEISRGCSWRQCGSDRNYAGCAFCNLNLQWDGYRSKKPSQVVSEIDHLTSKYKALSVSFMDNVLPVKESQEIFAELGKLNKDFSFFSEIRASTPKRVLELMRAAGLQKVQIGIESLSSRLLKKMNKGTTAIQNLEIMKHCEELGIENTSNLILHFPGSDQQDVDETLRSLEFTLPFHPLRLVFFWLGLESPVWQDPKSFGLKVVFNHPNYAALFPPKIFNSMPFMIQAYRGDLQHQRKLWQPVKQKVKTWQKVYNELRKRSPHRPILSFRDGRDFLIIHQKQLGAEPMTHRLVGTSREIYLFCQKSRSLKSIIDHFQKLNGDKIVPFLRMMVDKRLMFEENQKYLSLAVPVNRKPMG